MLLMRLFATDPSAQLPAVTDWSQNRRPRMASAGSLLALGGLRSVTIEPDRQRYSCDCSGSEGWIFGARLRSPVQVTHSATDTI
jgi:hypothetical protein